MQLGMIGLGRMGGNMARRLARGGHACVAFDRDPDAIAALTGEGAVATASLAALVAALAPPRHVWLMVPAGEPTEATIAELAGMLAPGDTFEAQCSGVFAQIERALQSAGAGWGSVAQFTTYLVHSQDIARFMQWRLREFPRLFPDGAYPPNTLLIVDRLVQEQFLVEAQTVAAI